MHLLIPTVFLYFFFEYPVTKDTFSKPMICFHNGWMSVFSFHIFKELLCIILRMGLVFQREYYFKDSDLQFYLSLFYLSKYYEFVDIMILQSKQNTNPSLLQYYHHIGALYMWHLCCFEKVDAVVLGSLWNAGIHSIMYFYYFLISLRHFMKIPTVISCIKPWITMLQILQFVVSFGYSTYYYFPPVETLKNYVIISLSNAYIIGLIYLFGDFFIHRYIGVGRWLSRRKTRVI